VLCARVRARLDSSNAVFRVRGYLFVDAGFPDVVGDDEGDGTGDAGEFDGGEVVGAGGLWCGDGIVMSNENENEIHLLVNSEPGLFCHQIIGVNPHLFPQLFRPSALHKLSLMQRLVRKHPPSRTLRLSLLLLMYGRHPAVLRKMMTPRPRSRPSDVHSPSILTR
jgi:hypothetical protein